MTKNNKKGFTLIEILVVIGIIAILAAIVLIAINPARQFAQARNTQRSSDVNAIINAIGQRFADNQGVFEAAGECPALPQGVANEDGIDNAAGGTGVDLATNCLVPTYISALPIDPDPSVAGVNTGYSVYQDATNRRVTVCAHNTESPLTTDICITR